MQTLRGRLLVDTIRGKLAEVLLSADATVEEMAGGAMEDRQDRHEARELILALTEKIQTTCDEYRVER